MLNDSAVSVCRLMATAAWSLVAGVLTAAWVVQLLGSWRIAQLLGFTACVCCGVAVTAHMRCMTIRAVRLVVLSIHEDEEPSRVRSLR